MVATASMAVLGVVWGILSGSSVILFDGVYGALGVALTWLAMVASRLVAGGPTAKYPFGREALAPMVITLQGIALLGTCLYASIDAVMVIVDGGSDVSAGSAMVYGFISAVTARGRVGVAPGPGPPLRPAAGRGHPVAGGHRAQRGGDRGLRCGRSSSTGPTSAGPARTSTRRWCSCRAPC